LSKSDRHALPLHPSAALNAGNSIPIFPDLSQQLGDCRDACTSLGIERPTDAPQTTSTVLLQHI